MSNNLLYFHAKFDLKPSSSSRDMRESFLGWPYYLQVPYKKMQDSTFR